jgi:16S rRNA processing protein RimM
MKSSFTIIGKVKKTQGVTGEIIIELVQGIRFDDKVPEWMLFRKPNEAGIPKKVEKSLLRNQSLLLKMEGISSMEIAKQFIGNEVLCDENLLEKANEFQEIEEGYIANDKTHGNFGTIKSVIQSAGQLILSIEHPSGKEILFPFHEDLMISIDRPNKIIYLEAPEGLIELYLNG